MAVLDERGLKTFYTQFKAWVLKKIKGGVVVSSKAPTDDEVSIWINPDDIEVKGVTTEVVIDTEEPTDLDVKIWINPASND